MEKKKKKKNHWHQPFGAAMRLEFKDNREGLDFEEEHELSREPLRIDLLIIKKKPGVKITNEIGRFFRGYIVNALSKCVYYI